LGITPEQEAMFREEEDAKVRHRVQRVLVPTELLLQTMENTLRTSDDELPTDAKVIGVAYDYATDSYGFTVRSASFPESPPGNVIKVYSVAKAIPPEATP